MQTISSPQTYHTELVGERPGSPARENRRSQTEISYGTAQGGGEQLGYSKLVIERRAVRISIRTRPSQHATSGYRCLRIGVGDANTELPHSQNACLAPAPRLFVCLFISIKPKNPDFASRPGLEVKLLGVYPLGPRNSSRGPTKGTSPPRNTLLAN